MHIETFEDPRLRLLICGYVRLPPGRWHYSNTSVPYWRLYWNADPGAFIHHGRQNIELKPSGVVLVAPNTIISTSNHKRVQHLYVHFQIPAFYTGVSPQITSFAVTPPVRGVIRELIHLLQNQTRSCWRLSLVVHALAELAVSKLMDEAIRIPQLDARILAVLAFLDENLGSAISNPILARHAEMSTSAFNRLFKAQIGHSPQAYLRLKQVEKACMMLLFESSIKQIAAATGFCDRYHFSRVFKRIQGIGPAEFRRLNQNPFVSNPYY